MHKVFISYDTQDQKEPISFPALAFRNAEVKVWFASFI